MDACHLVAYISQIMPDLGATLSKIWLWIRRTLHSIAKAHLLLRKVAFARGFLHVFLCTLVDRCYSPTPKKSGEQEPLFSYRVCDFLQTFPKQTPVCHWQAMDICSAVLFASIFKKVRVARVCIFCGQQVACGDRFFGRAIKLDHVESDEQFRFQGLY